MGTLVDLNSEPAVEELSRQILSEAKLWEAIQEARIELLRRRQEQQMLSNRISDRPGMSMPLTSYRKKRAVQPKTEEDQDGPRKSSPPPKSSRRLTLNWRSIPFHPVLCFREAVHLLILHVTIWVEGTSSNSELCEHGTGKLDGEDAHHATQPSLLALSWTRQHHPLSSINLPPSPKRRRR
ncbi:unnamed protein product [Timema podura]|uniref:Uncharacterized protein n=1 Tax=Timema podura TaxID=61482 RepID=A0ABN7NXC3_TIMPD|nr:unnamed protein product [Timema podura]